MVIKTLFMLSLYLVPYFLMLSGIITNVWVAIGMWALMGFGMAGIGLSIMHDAIHESYSKNKTVNFVLGYLIHIIGGCKTNWKIQHNVLHHSFTNINEYDEDIEIGVMRFTPDREWKWFHRFQIFYGPVLYGIMTLSWAIDKDFNQLIRYHKNGLLERHGIDFKKTMTELVINKALYFTAFLVIPLIFMPFAWWQVVIGFVAMHFVCGLTLALIFQSAHVLEETEFFSVEEGESMENNWAIHQLKTTANFANTSGWFTWLIGALNYQVEHHLFPNICHVHYPKLAPIVKQTAEDYGIVYNSHHTFFQALGSHFKLLNALGKNQVEPSMKKEELVEA
jgi:linoleoyl-CoA desaturase